MSDDTEDSEASEFDYGGALGDIAAAAAFLASARLSMAMVAIRFDASATSAIDAKAAAEQGEPSISKALKHARKCVEGAAMMLWSVRHGMADAMLPAAAVADLEQRLSDGDRALTALFPIVLPPATLLVPFYVAHEGETPARKWPKGLH